MLALIHGKRGATLGKNACSEFDFQTYDRRTVFRISRRRGISDLPEEANVIDIKLFADYQELLGRE